jgi:hypothetical protein
MLPDLREADRDAKARLLRDLTRWRAKVARNGLVPAFGPVKYTRMVDRKAPRAARWGKRTQLSEGDVCRHLGPLPLAVARPGMTHPSVMGGQARP